jgi:FkbM family methyltransferase
MLLDLLTLKNKYNIKTDGIIHVGGHFGKEIDQYKSIFPSVKIEIFEPHPETFKVLKKKSLEFNDVNCHNIGIGSCENKLKLYCETSNEGQSNSLLKPKIHTLQYPNIVFTKTTEVDIKPLDSYCFGEEFNFLNMDVQGFELEVLKGAIKTLKHINYILTEVNNKELYENCCLVSDLDNFLINFGFKRTDTNWEGVTWGDAFYIKNI